MYSCVKERERERERYGSLVFKASKKERERGSERKRAHPRKTYSKVKHKNNVTVDMREGRQI